MRHLRIVLATTFLALATATISRSEEPKKAKTVDELFEASKGDWVHYSEAKTLSSFQFGRYSSQNPKAAPTYRIALIWKEKFGENHYGQAESVEIVEPDSLKITLPPVKKGDPKRELLVKREGEALEVRVIDGPAKGIYKVEKSPVFPDRKTVLATFQEGWGDSTKKLDLAEFRFYPCIIPDATGRPIQRYYITLKPRQEGTPSYFGPADAVEETKSGELKIVLPKAPNDKAERIVMLKRDQDSLVVTIDGPLKGEYKLDKLPPFKPFELLPDFRGSWYDLTKKQPLTEFAIGAIDTFRGPPIVIYHMSVRFNDDDEKDPQNHYGRVLSVAEDAKSMELKVTYQPQFMGAAKRELFIKRNGEKLEVRIPDGKFKGTHTVEKRSK